MLLGLIWRLCLRSFHEITLSISLIQIVLRFDVKDQEGGKLVVVEEGGAKQVMMQWVRELVGRLKLNIAQSFNKFPNRCLKRLWKISPQAGEMAESWYR